MLDSDTFWLAFGLMLVFEGLLPFLSPPRWRHLLAQLLQLQDGHIRLFAALSIGAGLLLISFWT